MRTPRRETIFASKADLVTTLAVGFIAAAYVIIALIVRLSSVLSNDGVPVLISVRGIDRLPLGPSAASIPADVATATVFASDMPPVTLLSVAGAAIVPAIASLAIIGCSMVLLTRLLQGRFFSRSNTALVGAISVIVAVAWAVGGLLATMASNGVLALMSGREMESVQFQVDFVPLLIAMGIGSLCAAFHAGDRMRHDTEGLV